MTSMIAVQIVGLQLDPSSGVNVVLLGETETPTRVLPILIGPNEARSIAGALAGVVPPRPATHDLMVDLIQRVGCQLEEVAVTELVDGTFFAELFVEAPSGLHRVPARPSDGIALAVRVGVPIVVNATVLDAAAIAVRRKSPDPFSDSEIDEIVNEFQTFLETTNPSDFAPGDPNNTGGAQ